MELKINHLKVDVHIKKPGSRGGHIIGYRAGEPIYGAKKPIFIRKATVKTARSVRVSDPIGKKVETIIHKNPSRDDLKKHIPPNVRAWLTPGGDMFVADNPGLLHDNVMEAIQKAKFITKSEAADLVPSMEDRDSPLITNPKHGVMLERVGDSAAFHLAETYLNLEELEVESMGSIKSAMRNARKKSKDIIFSTSRIRDIEAEDFGFKPVLKLKR